MTYPQNQLRNIIRIALFAALTAVGAFIKIPTPLVPFTLQIFFVFLSGALLGAKHGLYAQTLYIGIGLIGFPILANGGGISYIFQPSFGFLIGNIFGAYIIGRLVEKSKRPSKRTFIQANLIGLAIIYLVGLIYFYMILNFWLDKPTTWSYALGTAIIPFIILDLIKCVLAGWVGERLRPFLSNPVQNKHQQ